MTKKRRRRGKTQSKIKVELTIGRAILLRSSVAHTTQHNLTLFATVKHGEEEEKKATSVKI